MAIFSNTSYVAESVVFDDVQPTMEGSAEIMYEFASDIYKLISATYVADVMIESAVSEGATDVEALVEATAKEFKDKVVKKFKELKQKIAAWFKRVIDKIKVFFMGSTKFIEQYQKAIEENFKNMKKKPTYKGFEYMSLDSIKSEHEKVVNGFKDVVTKAEAINDGDEAVDADEWFTNAVKSIGNNADSLSELKEALVEKYRGGSSIEGEVTVSDVKPLIESLKNKSKTISGIEKMAADTEKEINKIIANLNKVKDDAKVDVIAIKSRMFTQCVNAIQGVTSVTVSMINEIVKVNHSVLKKIVTMKPAKESFEETGSIFESALNIV